MAKKTQNKTKQKQNQKKKKNPNIDYNWLRNLINSTVLINK